jgi:hypothetical protein
MEDLQFTGYSTPIIHILAPVSGEEHLTFLYQDNDFFGVLTEYMDIDSTFKEHAGYADNDQTDLAFQSFDDEFTGIFS